MHVKKWIGFAGIIMLSLTGFAQRDTTKRTNPIHDDAYLHPIDCISPYTLRKGEWIYAQSIQTLPFPSWAFVGITDKLTAQIDLLPLIFGTFSELKKPIPSLNLKYRFNEGEGVIPTFAIEAMYVHFWDTLKRFETPSLSVWENGSYFHLKPVIAYQFGVNWNLNLSLGVDYMNQLILQNNAITDGELKTINKKWRPNGSVGIDYRPSNWISYHLGYSYGSTLTYLENVPGKHQFNYGFRIAPFYKNRFGILRNLRIELVAINAYFPDIDAWQAFPIPVFPYFYWQWKKEK